MMKTLLMLAGYTAYQAQCVAPVLWLLLIGAAASCGGAALDSLHAAGKDGLK
ncbi:MAG: hypothetical protein ACI4LE_09645 [Faecalibacterium sp.]